MARALAQSIVSDSSGISTLASNLGKQPTAYKQETRTLLAIPATVSTSQPVMIDLTQGVDTKQSSIEECRKRIDDLKVQPQQIGPILCGAPVAELPRGPFSGASRIPF